MSVDAPRPPEEGEPPAAESAPAAASSPVVPEPVLVPRWIQAVVLPLALLGCFELIRGVGTLTVVFTAACVAALILTPICRRLERAMPRPVAIFTTYFAVTLLVVALLALLTEPFTTQISHLTSNLPHYTKIANRNLADLQTWLNKRGMHVHIVSQSSTALDSIEKRLEKSSGTILSVSRDVLGQLVSIGTDLVLILVLSIYLLYYGPKIGAITRRLMPPGDGTPQDDLPTLVQHAVSGYVQGQLALSTVMGVGVALVLWVFGVTGVFPAGRNYVLFFALFYGLAELVPYVGPLVGPIPPVALALITHPISAVWLLIAFICLQQLEGHLMAPQIFRISLRINPIVVILSLLIGYHLYGIPGALLALPVATVVRQTALYLSRHLELELWPRERARPLALAPTTDAGRSALAGDAAEVPDDESGHRS